MPPSVDPLPPDLNAALHTELQPGETLLWSGQPTPRELRRQSFGLAFVGLCFVGFGIFWVVATLREAMRYAGPNHGHIPWALLGFPLGGVPFLGLGLLMLTTPLWRGRRAIRIGYAVTDRRAIAFHGEILNDRIDARSFLPAQMKQLQVIDRRDGGGDLVFDRVMMPAGKTQVLKPIGFFGIANAHEVEAIIRSRLLPAS